MKSKRLIWLLALCLGAGCGDNFTVEHDDPDARRLEPDAPPPIDAPPAGSSDAPSPEFDGPPPINGFTWRYIVRNPDEPLQRRIDAALYGIDHDDCFLNGGDVSSCDWDMFTAGPFHVEPQFNQREAVLIVDLFVPSVEMLRYRNRIHGFYEVASDGTISGVPLEWELPEVFGDIITGFATSPAIPAEDFGALLPRLQEVYGDSIPALGTHGLAVFNILADLIPHNPVVFLDNSRLTFHQAIPGVVCAIEPDQDGEIDVQPLVEHAERFAQSLRALFQIHDIRFVNASWGYTIDTVRGPWMSVCGTEPPSDEVLLAILEAYRPVFDALFNTEGVFTAHASLASPVDEHYPFDQPSPEFPNRLRVGVFQHNGDQVPYEGRTEVPPEWLPVPEADDADVWVNSGCANFFDCRAERPLSLTVQYGMGRSVFPLAQSSFLNPVLLGAFVHLRNQMSLEEMDDSLIDDIIATLVPECAFGLTTYCRYIDPLYHEQLDRYDPPSLLLRADARR